MKKAIMALDGGGSNLRMVVADYYSEKSIYFNEINTGTNLSTVSNKQKAINNIQNLVIEGFDNLKNPNDAIKISLENTAKIYEVEKTFYRYNSSLLLSFPEALRWSEQEPDLYILSFLKLRSSQ